jgi:hypothetical protein
MGWVADCAELAVALVDWGKKRYQSAAWKKKLDTVSADLLREDVDLRTAHETVKLAHDAGYAGPELLTVEERIAAIEGYERKRAKPPRSTATKMRKKKPVKRKPARKKKPGAKKQAPAKRRAKKRAKKKPARR